MRPLLPALVLPVLLAACSDGASDRAAGDPFAADPLVAAALSDPLMSDPDLSARNEANAVLGFAGDSALPLLPATTEAAQAAREAARLELLEDGDIVPLPPASASGAALPDPGAGAEALLAALGAPARCGSAISEDFRWAAALPQVAAIMPQGMVMQAGGANASPCALRIIRYQTPAAPEDVLQYHYMRAGRAGLEPLRQAGKGESIVGRGAGGEVLIVTVRKAAGGLTAVDLAYRAAS